MLCYPRNCFGFEILLLVNNFALRKHVLGRLVTVNNDRVNGFELLEKFNSNIVDIVLQHLEPVLPDMVVVILNWIGEVNHAEVFALLYAILQGVQQPVLFGGQMLYGQYLFVEGLQHVRDLLSDLSLNLKPVHLVIDLLEGLLLCHFNAL